MRWRLPARGARAGSLRERCEERVRSLRLPDRGQVTVEELCDYVSPLSGRPIRLIPMALPAGSPDGLWVSAEHEDFVVFERRLAPVHQQQVILHEFGHVICAHEATPVLTPEASRLLLPSLDPEMVRRSLGREHSQTEAEVEAEYVGSLIGRHIVSWTPEQSWPVPAEAQEIAARLKALEAPYPRGSNE
ncbi:hypothetical protein ACFVYD_10955 [Streptomyces sp. NPDC058301]|uniref:hypothetical protein n=1 Tax=Streptomyces sp. NPDC058301 TaxID=3346436 RepID=UPI0036E2512B